MRTALFASYGTSPGAHEVQTMFTSLHRNAWFEYVFVPFHSFPCIVYRRYTLYYRYSTTTLFYLCCLSFAPAKDVTRLSALLIFTVAPLDLNRAVKSNVRPLYSSSVLYSRGTVSYSQSNSLITHLTIFCIRLSNSMANLALERFRTSSLGAAIIVVEALKAAAL